LRKFKSLYSYLCEWEYLFFFFNSKSTLYILIKNLLHLCIYNYKSIQKCDQMKNILIEKQKENQKKWMDSKLWNKFC
jgi:hypothetical protein